MNEGRPTSARLKVVVVHPALAPYRVDQFNTMARLYDVTVIFLFANVWNHPFDQAGLLAQAEFKYLHLVKGLEWKGRVFTRTGLLRTLRSLKPDVVISVEFSFATQLFSLLKAIGLFKPRLGSTIDDSLAICRRPQSRARALARSLIVRHLDYLMLLSQPVADYYGQTYRIKPDRLVVAPIVQDPSRLRARSAELDAIAEGYVNRLALKGRKVVLFVGRLIPEKGLLPFLIHIRSVLSANAELRFVIVGDGSERESLRRFVEAESLETQVLLPGRFEDLSLHAWYVAATGFVLPSLFEPFGAVINEALIFGLNVMCSRVAGSAPIAEEAGGLLFTAENGPETVNVFEKFIAALPVLVDVRVAARPSHMKDPMPQMARELQKLSVVPT